MSDLHDRPVPKGALIAIASVVVFTILAVGIARLTGFDPRQATLSPEIASLDLRFDEVESGELLVWGPDDTLIERVPVGEDGFIRGLLRTLHRERRMHGVDLDGPYRLSLREGGYYLLLDPSTDFTVDLRAFGPDNKAALARFMANPSREP